MISRTIYLAIMGCLFAIVLSASAMAEEIRTSKYFDVSLSDGIDKVELLKKLKADYFLKVAAPFASEEDRDDDKLNDLLGKTLDALYFEVSDILDIHMYDFSTTIEILPDKAGVLEATAAYFDLKQNFVSYYYSDNNRIYISYENMTVGMLAHEIARAIVARYFPVAPPVRLQEILSGYVDYAVRKKTGDTQPGNAPAKKESAEKSPGDGGQ